MNTVDLVLYSSDSYIVFTKNITENFKLDGKLTLSSPRVS